MASEDSRGFYQLDDLIISPSTLTAPVHGSSHFEYLHEAFEL